MEYSSYNFIPRIPAAVAKTAGKAPTYRSKFILHIMCAPSTGKPPRYRPKFIFHILFGPSAWILTLEYLVIDQARNRDSGKYDVVGQNAPHNDDKIELRRRGERNKGN